MTLFVDDIINNSTLFNIIINDNNLKPHIDKCIINDK